MGKRDLRIDAYIAKSADFAQPILIHLRELIHQACPQIEETIKWGMPFFDFRGSVCNIAAFKQHCTLGFWKGRLLFAEEAKHATAMGQFGRITSLKDLPSNRVLIDLINKAVQLNEAGIKAVVKKVSKPQLAPPADLLAALKKNRKALAAFEAFSPSCKREYIEWLIDAKREETRAKRLAQAIEWISAGKSRNWKYAKAS